MTPIKKQFQYGRHPVTIETGEIARQADGAVMVDMDGTVVQVTVVCEKENEAVRDFLQMTIDYQEKTYAAGKIPGGFFRREGRASEQEVLNARLIDRPIRPLIPESFGAEMQIICTVMSLNPKVDPEVPSIIGASAALSIAGVPFNGPVGAARVGYKNGEYILNGDKVGVNKSSDLDLIVAGTEDAVLMVESEANELTEEIMLGAVIFGHEQQQIVIREVKAFAEEVAKPVLELPVIEGEAELKEKVTAACSDALGDAYLIADKMARYSVINSVIAEAKATILGSDSTYTDKAFDLAIESVQRDIVRGRVMSGEPRIDGRDTRSVRPISIRRGVLPRAHGSVLFTRGETQALVVTTLGTERESQIIDALEGSRRDPFMLHYNFLPFSVGETGRVGNPKRREIGHGRLAKRGVLAAMPTLKDFPYAIRVVSEITESNGSSSMASVCGTSLSLMDAGVPLKSPVAGVAMGLIKEDDAFAVLTDILADEDHLGDMDFKVAGTKDGINALQMDIKINGITREIMEVALDQARDGRLHILEEMAKVIDSPNQNVSEHAPRMVKFHVKQDKVREVIGKGGATIRSICDDTGATVDINNDGLVRIFSVNQKASDAARKRVEQITTEVEVGVTYEGKVTRLMDFGAFVNILPGKDGLVHISQICEERVEKVTDKLSEGDAIKVKVLEVDKQGRIRLSMKAVVADEAAGNVAEKGNEAE